MNPDEVLLNVLKARDAMTTASDSNKTPDSVDIGSKDVNKDDSELR